MEDKRLDLDAPLLSVRRFSVPPPVKPATKSAEPAAAKPLTPLRRSALPFYKSELKSGPVRNPGVVPFVWEKRPGQPKAGAAARHRPPQVPLLPPGRTPNGAELDRPFSNPNSIRENKTMKDAAEMSSEEFLKIKEEEEEGDNFSDAVETFSRSESFFMNCSVSVISGIPDAVEPSGSFSTDPQVRDLMMDRFLPAAQAMTTGSPKCPPRKPAKQFDRVENGEHRLSRAPLPYQHRPNFVARYPRDEIDSSDGGDEDYDNNYEGNRHFASKACGLLPRLGMKSPFCLLNPMPGMKVGVRRHRLPPSTSGKISSVSLNNGPLSQAEDELWEAVYKHKLSLGIPHQGEDGSKRTSKSNQHGQWSVSQTLDGSSSCRHSGGSKEALVGILMRDRKNGKSDGSESFDKDGERYWGTSSSHGSQKGSGVSSPIMVKSAHVDSGLLMGIPNSKHSSIDNEMGFRTLEETSRSANVVSEGRVDYQEKEETHVLERYTGLVLQTQSPGILESDLISCSGRSVPGGVGRQNSVEHVNSSDGSVLLKGEERSKNNSNLHSLLPPPLPKTPSESWLSRTLPSVSTKIPSGQSSLGIYVLQKKQGLHSSSTAPRQESDAKPLESQPPQIPCAIAKLEIHTEPSKLHQCQITPTELSEDSSIKHSEPQNDQILDIKPSKPLRRQIRFADVLMTPISPRSEM